MDGATSPLHPTTWATLRALRAGARLSRNRHFYLYQHPQTRRAIRLHRYLQSVVRDVERYADELSVECVEGDRYALRIEFPIINGRRTAYLRSFELELLAEHAPQVAELLQALREQASP